MSTASSTRGLYGFSGDLYVSGNYYASNISIPNSAGVYQDLTTILQTGISNYLDLDTSDVQTLTGNKEFKSLVVGDLSAAGVLQVGNSTTSAQNSTPPLNIYSSCGFYNDYVGAGSASPSLLVNARTVVNGNAVFYPVNSNLIFDLVLGGSLNYVINAQLSYNTGYGSLVTVATTTSNIASAASANSGVLYQWYNVRVNLSTNPAIVLPDPCYALAGYTVNFVRTGGTAAAAYPNQLTQGNSVTVTNASYPGVIAGSTNAQVNAFATNVNAACSPNVVLGYVGQNQALGIYWFKSGFMCIPNYDDPKSTNTNPVYCWNQYFYQ